jgi:ATP-binding cassette, subfamily C (CFTR/MRP), member 1
VELQDIGNGIMELKKVEIASIRGKFTWPQATQPTIDIENWSIRRKTFTLLLGPVGCGKSSLLKLLLGELSGFDGTIRTAFSTVAFCEQSPWLPNLNVQSVITGSCPYEPAWYQTVVAACAMQADMQQWPEGDQSLIGSKGISLSGGQKQRIVSVI